MADDRREKDFEETGELDYPPAGEADGAPEPTPHPTKPDTGFEGWLDGPADGKRDGGPEAPPGSDPYADLADGEATDEIADWMAFTSGTEDADPSPEAPDDKTGEPQTEPFDEEAGAEVDAPEDGHDDTDEFELVESATDDADGPGSTGDDPGEGPADDHDPDAPEVDAEATEVPAVDSEDTDAEDETTEVEPIGEVHRLVPEDEPGYGAEPGDEATSQGLETEFEVIGFDDDEPVFDGKEVAGESGEGAGIVVPSSDDDDLFPDLTKDEYLQTATTDHADLAAAVAATADEDTEQVALAADIPGLESSVVGFEDVVDAEGGEHAPPASRSDLLTRVLTAAVLVAAFAASLFWLPALIALALVLLLVAAGEFYTTLLQQGFKPLTLFGFLAVIGAGLGTTAWGVIAIPAALFLAATILLLFYAVAPSRDRPLENFSMTMLVALWVGALGGFAFDIFQADDYQVLVVGVVALVALMDTAQLFVGRGLGRRTLAPVISPNKTLEGLIGGVVVAFLAGAALGYFEPFDLVSGLALGAVVAVFGPLGDLAVSAVKRSLDVKDMGTVLPGHGGVLDRIDGLLFVIPAAWVAFIWLELL